MKNKNYHIVRTIPKLNAKVVEGGKTDTNNCLQTSIMYQPQLYDIMQGLYAMLLSL